MEKMETDENKGESDILLEKKAQNKNEVLENQLELESLIQEVEKVCDKEFAITEKVEVFLAGKNGSKDQKSKTKKLLEKVKDTGLEVLRNATKSLRERHQEKRDKVREKYVDKHFRRASCKVRGCGGDSMDKTIRFYDSYLNNNVDGEFTERDREDIEQRTKEVIKMYHEEVIRLYKIQISISKNTHYGYEIGGIFSALARYEYNLGMKEEIREMLDLQKNDTRGKISNNLLHTLQFASSVKNNHTMPESMEKLEEEFGYIPELFLQTVYQRNIDYHIGDKHDITRIYTDRFLESYKDGEKISSSVQHVISLYYEKHYDELTPEKKEKLFQFFMDNDAEKLADLGPYLFDQLHFTDQESKDKIFEAIRGTYFRYRPEILATLPITKFDLEKIYAYDGEKTYRDGDPQIEGKDFQEIRKLFGERGVIIPLLHPDLFDITNETKKDLLKEIGSTGTKETGILLINSYELLTGIDDRDKKEAIYSCLLKNRRNSHYTPELAEKVILEMRKSGIFTEEDIALFSEKLSIQEGDRFIEKVLEKTRANPESAFANPENIYSLEKAFCNNVDEDTLRHEFFEVLEGNKVFKNFDLIYEKYLEQQHPRAEEFISLFIIKKQLDQTYAEKYLKRVSRDIDNFYNQLNEQKTIGAISAEDYEWAMKSLREFLPAQSLTILFEIDMTEKDSDSVATKNALAGVYAENFVKKIKELTSKDRDPYIYRYIERLEQSGISKELENKYKKEIVFATLYNDEVIHILASYFSQHDYDMGGAISEANINEIKQTFSKTKNIEALRIFLYGLSGDSLDEEQKKKVVKSATESLNLDLYTILLDFTNRGVGLDEEQKREVINLLPAFLKKTVFTTEGNPQHRNLLLGIIKNLPFHNEISDDKMEEIFMLSISGENSLLANASTEKFTFLTDTYKDDEVFSFFGKYPRLLPKFIEEYTKEPNADILELLQQCRVNQKEVDIETVKRLTKSVVEKTGMTGALYSSYLSSLTEKNPYLYMDRELFDDAISKLEISGNSAETTSFFEAYNKKNNRLYPEHENAFTLSAQKEKDLYHIAFSGVNGLETLYKYNPELFVNEIKSALEKGDMGYAHNLVILQNKQIQIPEDVESSFVQQLALTMSNERAKYSNEKNKTLIEEYVKRHKDKGKEKINIFLNPILNGKNIFARKTVMLEFLRNNLLNELQVQRTFQEVRKAEDVRNQVLTCAEILGVLIFDNSTDIHSESLLNFFGPEKDKQKNNLQAIKSFAKEYSLEDKGRTIATMLFAKEYLPDREPGEILDKVVSRLRKYEKVLERYQYKNIPEGLNASIGMEYEITSSTAGGYRELTGRDLSGDIKRLSEIAKIGQGRDAVHEIATRPVTNPYLLLLEIEVLQDLEYIDFNFDRTPNYQRGSRGFHLTIGGEKGLQVNNNTQFLQNIILMTSWGGIHAGSTGKKANGGRGVSLRGRNASDSNNIKVFNKPSSSVELRSLSIDKVEPFERTILSSFYGSVAIQALEEHGLSSYSLMEVIKNNEAIKNGQELFEKTKEQSLLTKKIEDQKVEKIVVLWMDLLVSVSKAITYHNENFLEGETQGYVDEDGLWVERESFGGEYNKKRFDEVVQSINPSESVEEYLDGTRLEIADIFGAYSTNFADKLTKINNLYLKPSKHMKGDQANATAMLQVTKTDNATIEMREPEFLESSIFDMLGEKRKGYYTLQGASERMITHAIQKVLLEFNERMEEVLN